MFRSARFHSAGVTWQAPNEFPGVPAASRIYGTILLELGVNNWICVVTLPPTLLLGGDFFVHRQLAGERREKWTSNFM